MSSTRRGFAFAFLVLASVGSFSAFAPGCSTEEVNENDPAALMKDAEDDIGSNRYLMALEKLQKVKNQHPYSKQAVDAQLRIADVYFLQENYSEAAATYEAFRDLHPKNPKLPYAAFRVGLSYFNDVPGNIARDLSPAYKAQDAFRDYLAHFPNDPNVPEAKSKLAETRKDLAEKETYIADFYYKRGMWEAAKGRYSKIVNEYSDTPSLSKAEDRLKAIETKPPEERTE
jgi:outer membrane protein assembly factor BamD